MKRIRAFSSGIPINWLVVGMTLLLAMALGMAISGGKQKTVAFLFVAVSVLVVRTFSERLKFWLLALSIPLSLVQIPTLPLPYGASISELILVVLALEDILFTPIDQTYKIKSVKPAMFIILGLFSIAGLIANVRGGDINSWTAYCLIPILWFFLAYRKIHDPKDAWLFIKLALLTIVGFVAIVIWANATGHFTLLHPGTTTYTWRLGSGLLVAFGPIRLSAWSTILGSIAALGCPSAIILWLTNKNHPWWQVVAFLILGFFIYALIASSVRGSVIAAILGVFIVLLVSFRFRSPLFLGTIALLLGVFYLSQESILNFLRIQNIQRLLTLSQGLNSIGNFTYRMNVLALAWKLTLQNPVGVGFGYFWNMYQIDDAIIYAILLEGTGILGAIAFVLIVGQLAIRFGLTILKPSSVSARDLASIGLSTLAAGLVAGVSSSGVIFQPVHAFVFWAVMAVCFCAVVNPSS